MKRLITATATLAAAAVAMAGISGTAHAGPGHYGTWSCAPKHTAADYIHVDHTTTSCSFGRKAAYRVSQNSIWRANSKGSYLYLRSPLTGRTHKLYVTRPDSYSYLLSDGRIRILVVFGVAFG